MGTHGTRLNYEESCKRLQELGLLEAGETPAMPLKLPGCDDEEVRGISFFRTRLCDCKLENLTLSRTLFGRSLVQQVSFRGSDLRESNLCWNDFIDVEFVDADLSGSDLRASIYENVRFVRADLTNADLRRSSLDNCSFRDALMCGAKLTARQAENLDLSDAQRAAVSWQADDGPEPDGG